MQRKEFQAIADTLRSCKPADYAEPNYGCELGQWNLTVAKFAIECSRHNPRFDRDRFLKACGVSDA